MLPSYSSWSVLSSATVTKRVGAAVARRTPLRLLDFERQAVDTQAHIDGLDRQRKVSRPGLSQQIAQPLGSRCRLRRWPADRHDRLRSTDFDLDGAGELVAWWLHTHRHQGRCWELRRHAARIALNADRDLALLLIAMRLDPMRRRLALSP